MDDKNNSLEGKLFFHSETGTEGGYWAFQDSRFISQNTTRYSCRKCNLYWDKKEDLLPPELKSKDILPNCCSPDDHQFKPVCEENWSYEGLYILEDGDKLTIYHPYNNKEVWSGIIALKQHPLFTEDASGLWIHADQIGMGRKTWAEYFFREYRAKLVPIKKQNKV